MDFPQELSQAKRGNLGQLLFRCARLFNELAVERVQSGREPRFRVAHTSLFPHIDLEGTRLVDLAQRVGISKQAVGQLVQELEEMGTLTRERDPDDGRAWRVRFSPQGQVALLDGLALLRQLEGEMAESLGGERCQRLIGDLEGLLEILEARREDGSER